MTYIQRIGLLIVLLAVITALGNPTPSITGQLEFVFLWIIGCALFLHEPRKEK
jgi:hypothetical protein